MQGSGPVAVRMQTSQSLSFGTPEPLKIPNVRIRPNDEREIDVAPDGRILAVVEAPSTTRNDIPASASQIEVVVNWLQELKRVARAQ